MRGISVGTDGSEGAARAVQWAATRATAHGVPLTIVSYTPETPLPSRANVHRAMRQGNAADFAERVWARAQSRLDEAVAAARAAHPDLEISGELIKGHSAAEVLSALDVDLLVLGATGASAVDRILLGGTVAAVIQHATSPVVVVHESGQDGPVVVGLDDAESSAVVAQAAIREARATGSGLVALHAWAVDEDMPGLPNADEIDTTYDAMIAELTADAGVPVEREVPRGRPDKVLVERSREASLVVVGSRGRGGFAGLLLGSISRYVVAHAHCPVLVVRN